MEKKLRPLTCVSLEFPFFMDVLTQPCLGHTAMSLLFLWASEQAVSVLFYACKSVLQSGLHFILARVLDGASVPFIHLCVVPSSLNLRLKPHWVAEAWAFFDFGI